MKRKINCTTYTDYASVERGNQRFSVHYAYDNNPDLFQCAVSEIHPYDLAEYAWAKKDRPTSAAIIKNGKRISWIDLPEYDEDAYETADEYIDEVIDRMCVALRRANKGVQPQIDHT